MKNKSIFIVFALSLLIQSGCASMRHYNAPWEYKVVMVELLSDDLKNAIAKSPFSVKTKDGSPLRSKDYPERASRMLNEFGAQGWELISVQNNIYTFKRVKSGG